MGAREVTATPGALNPRPGVVAQRQDVDDRGLDPALPAAGEGEFPGHRGLREDSLVERVTESVTY